MHVAAHRPATHAGPVRPAAAAPGAAPKAPRPRPVVRASGPVDTSAKTVGALLGTAAGAGGAAALGMFFSIGGNSIPLVGWAMMAAATLLGTSLGFLGGDRIGDWLERKPAAGRRYMPAQLLAAPAGAVLGAVGGFWLGALMLPGPAVFATTAIAAALGAIGAAEGARVLFKAFFR